MTEKTTLGLSSGFIALFLGLMIYQSLRHPHILYLLLFVGVGLATMVGCHFWKNKAMQGIFGWSCSILSVVFLMLSALYAQKAQMIKVVDDSRIWLTASGDLVHYPLSAPFSDYINLMLEQHLSWFLLGLILLGAMMFFQQLIFLFDKQKDKIRVTLSLGFLVIVCLLLLSVNYFLWFLVFLGAMMGLIWIMWKHPGPHLAWQQKVILWSGLMLLGFFPLVLHGCLQQQTKIDFLFLGSLTCLGIALGTFWERFNNFSS